jgi:hypothetical protein
MTTLTRRKSLEGEDGTTSLPIYPKENRAVYRLAGVILIAQQAVFLPAFAILGAAISWPQSLGLPATDAFPLITENETAVFTGYYLYLLSSILLIPMAVALKAVFANERDSLLTVVLNIAVAFGIVSGAMKVLGIVRWLFAMPALAAVYLDAQVSQAVREAAALNYTMLNAYAGKLGEHIGVQLLTTLFIGTLGFVLLRSRRVSAWFGYTAFIVALMALPYEDLLGVDLGPLLSISGAATGLWTIVLGITLLVKARRMMAQKDLA